MRADRLLQIVGLLRRHGRLSATELAERLEVTPRTVLRDMEALSSAGVPVYAERGRAGGFALLAGYKPAVEELTAGETQALLLSGTGAVDRIGLGAPLGSALRKLSGTLSPDLIDAAERAAERIVIDPSGWFDADDGLPHFATVQRAALGDRRLRLRYRHRNATRASVRTVDPYGLLQAGRTWYLIAAHRGRPHTFRIDRVESATVLPEPSDRPADLDLRALWQQLRSSFARPPTLTVRLELTGAAPSEVMIMLASVGSGRPRLAEGPPVTIEVETLGVHAAVAALGGMGAGVRVLHPPELVEHLVRSLQEARALYEEDTGPSSPAGP